MLRDPLLVVAFMLAVVAFARWLEERYDVIKKISSAVVCTLLGITLANVGVIEHTGPAHEAVFTFAIPYAIVLVIMGTQMKELAHAGRPLLIAYLAACGGSFVGGAVAGATMAGWVGPETWKLSGAFSAAFAGGGMNFAAVGQGLEVEPSTFAAAALADNMSTVPYLLFQVWLAGVFWRRSSCAGAVPDSPRRQPPTPRKGQSRRRRKRRCAAAGPTPTSASRISPFWAGFPWSRSGWHGSSVKPSRSSLPPCRWVHRGTDSCSSSATCRKSSG